MKLKNILNDIIIEHLQKRDDEVIISEEVSLFQELADPNFSYKYEEVKLNEWEFNDKYGNTLGVRFIPQNKYFEAYYLMKDLKIGRAHV